jgi:hypothetical protein
MKDKAVHEIFSQSPEKDTEYKTQRDVKRKAAACQARQMVFDGDVQEIEHDGHPNDCHDSRVDVGEKFEEIGFEKTYGLLIIHNFDVAAFGHGLTSQLKTDYPGIFPNCQANNRGRQHLRNRDKSSFVVRCLVAFRFDLELVFCYKQD